MSKTIQKPIADCTKEELRAFANTACGLSIGQNDSRAQILAKLGLVHTQETISVADVPERALAPVAQPVDQTESHEGLTLDQARALRDARLYTVLIPATEEKDGKIPVWLSVNGRGQWVQRGKTQVIREPYFHALNNARRKVYEQHEVNGLPGPMVPMYVHSYPFQIIKDPRTEEERAAADEALNRLLAECA